MGNKNGQKVGNLGICILQSFACLDLHPVNKSCYSVNVPDVIHSDGIFLSVMPLALDCCF